MYCIITTLLAYLTSQFYNDLLIKFHFFNLLNKRLNQNIIGHSLQSVSHWVSEGLPNQKNFKGTVVQYPDIASSQSWSTQIVHVNFPRMQHSDHVVLYYIPTWMIANLSTTLYSILTTNLLPSNKISIISLPNIPVFWYKTHHRLIYWNIYCWSLCQMA